MDKILLLHGPNLNMLGVREPDIYGTLTQDEIFTQCRERAAALGLILDCRQTNHEGVFIDWIHEAALDPQMRGVLINAAGWTHTSVALHDALKILKIPVFELHLSDPMKREQFRHTSLIAPIAAQNFSGKGIEGYFAALAAIQGL